jgi:hypothetical protein
VIDSLTFRAHAISHPDFLHDELKHITKQLSQNGYPLELINRRMKIIASRIGTPKLPDTNKRIILPYNGQLTHELSHYLRRKLDCTFGYIPGRKIGQLICTHKQKSKTEQIGIYKIPCSCKKLYIGETCRSLEDRIHEHKVETDNVNNNTCSTHPMQTRKKNAPPPLKHIVSAVAHHIKDNPSHKIHFNASKVIEPELRYFHRIFKEGLYIKKLGHNKINRDTGKNINPIWTSLLLPIIDDPTTLPHKNNTK